MTEAPKPSPILEALRTVGTYHGDACGDYEQVNKAGTVRLRSAKLRGKANRKQERKLRRSIRARAAREGRHVEIASWRQR